MSRSRTVAEAAAALNDEDESHGKGLIQCAILGECIQFVHDNADAADVVCNVACVPLAKHLIRSKKLGCIQMNGRLLNHSLVQSVLDSKHDLLVV